MYGTWPTRCMRRSWANPSDWLARLAGTSAVSTVARLCSGQRQLIAAEGLAVWFAVGLDDVFHLVQDA